MLAGITSKFVLADANRPLSRFLCTLCFFSSLFVLGFSAVCRAQQEQSNPLQKPVTISSYQIDQNKMPHPGDTITLRAEVNNTRDFRLPVRLLAVRDGKFQELSAQSGLLAGNERPQYQIDIPAPLAELIYQFILILPDGTAITSKRYSARRSCIPDITPALGEIPKEIDGSERFNLLLIDNLKLEEEISNLEKAAKEIDAVTELLKK